MKTIADFNDKDRLDCFVTLTLWNAYLGGHLRKVPVMHKIRKDKNGNNAENQAGHRYVIEDDEILVPLEM